MHVLTIRTDKSKPRFPADADLQGVLERVARGTDAQSLSVDLYLLSDCAVWRGDCRPARREAGSSDVSTPPDRATRPADIPLARPDIRIIIGDKWLSCGEVVTRYGMQIQCGGFADSLAFLFAHELHHYRRYHLGLHPGEGEVSADRWALECVQRAGFKVTGRRVQVSSRRRRPRIDVDDTQAAEQLMLMRNYVGMTWEEAFDEAARMDQQTPGRRVRQALHYEHLRQLPDGAPVQICHTGPNPRDAVFKGQIASKIRTPRRGSYRMPIRLSNKQEFYWPMEWLGVVEQPRTDRPDRS